MTILVQRKAEMQLKQIFLKQNNRHKKYLKYNKIVNTHVHKLSKKKKQQQNNIFVFKEV